MERSFIQVTRYCFFTLLVLHVTQTTRAQCKFQACENLYIGTIGVPTDNNDLITLRDALREDIAATLNALSPCTFIERNNQVDQRIRDERNEFRPDTYLWIDDYRDNYKRSIKWMLIGKIRRLSRFEYSLSIRIVQIATRTTHYTFTHAFTLDENYSYGAFLSAFKLDLLKETGQLIKIIGTTNYPKINASHISVFPTPWNKRVDFDPGKNEFSFHVSSCELEKQNLTIAIKSAVYTGELDTPIEIPETSAREVHVGAIKLYTTKGHSYRFKWQKPPKLCNDFMLRVHREFPNQKILTDTVKSISLGDFFFTIPKGTSLASQTTVSLVSNNYKQFAENIQLNFDQSTYNIAPGKRKSALAGKFVPGLHQWHQSPKLLSPIIILTQVGTLWAYFGATNKANQQRRDASLSTSFLTRQQLLNSANTNEDIAKAAMIGAIATYAFNWFHALFLKPCKTYKRKVRPTFSAGISLFTHILSLNIPIG